MILATIGGIAAWVGVPRPRLCNSLRTLRPVDPSNTLRALCLGFKRGCRGLKGWATSRLNRCAAWTRARRPSAGLNVHQARIQRLVGRRSRSLAKGDVWREHIAETRLSCSHSLGMDRRSYR